MLSPDTSKERGVLPFRKVLKGNDTEILLPRSLYMKPVSYFTSMLLMTVSVSAGPFRIDIVDEENGWPVPLVELRTTHNVRFVSDNAGTIAVDLPELMNRETWFTIEGHGYGIAEDRFGFKGVRLTPVPDGKDTVKVKRQLPAKRLGRITGAGIFGESQRLGLETDWKEQGVFGCDSVQNVVHKGKLFWAWGDTKIAKYPLGLFHMSGASTMPRPLTSLKPPVRLQLDYFTDEKNQPRNIAKLPGEGPTWLNGFASLPDKDGEMRMVASYVKVKGFLQVYEYGLCVWNEETENFEKHLGLWNQSKDGGKPPSASNGHPARWTDKDGKEWLLFGDPFPHLRCEPTFESWENPETREALDPQKSVPTRGSSDEIKPHRGSIAWNDYRKKWVTIFTQQDGEPSSLGEIWYAEAPAPSGPWGNAVKVVTHANYTFYNPKIHPGFTNPGSPVLLFEGTYTKSFSTNQQATPRYDYNQVLYRLDLDELAP